MWNHRMIKPHNKADEILAKWFFKMLETNDLRYILNYKNLPDLPEYNHKRLYNSYDKLQEEYDKLLGAYNYNEHYSKLNNSLRRKNKLITLISCYHLMKLGQNEALTILKIFNIHLKNCSYPEMIKLRNIIAQLKTEINIMGLRDKSEKDNNVKISFERNIVSIENSLSRNIDTEKLTLKKYVFLVKSVEARNKYLESLKGKYGRYHKKR